MNLHNWYGLLTNYNREINENLSFNFGADARYYNGLHFRAPTDLLGSAGKETTSAFSGTYVVNDIYGGYNPWSAVFNANDSNTQRVGYDYEEVITYIGGFGQLEYSQDAFSTFLQGAVSNQSYVKEDFWNFETAEKSEKLNKIGFNVKGGLGYALAENQKVYANAGYYSRQPFLDNIFESIRTSNNLITPEVDNESVLGFELGYALDNPKYDMNINLYHTTWGNRTIVSSFTDSTTQETTTTVLRGVEQTHMGVELDLMYKITDYAKLGAFVSVGDWNYGQNVDATIYDDDGNISEGDLTYYLDERKVGGAAQTTGGWNVEVKPLKDLSFDLSQRFYTNIYSNVGATTDESNSDFWSDENNAGPIKLPGYSLFDLGATYKWKLGGKKDLTFRFNVNNLTDAFYIEYSNGTDRGGDTWKGVSTSNNVEIGFGRTWNGSVRFNF